MATLKQQYDLTQDVKFSKRVIQGAVTVAFEVIQEAPTTAGHPLRVSLAQSVLSNPTAHEVRISAALLTDPTTFDAQVDSTTNPPTPKANQAADTALLERLRAVWNALAGVTA